MGCCTKDLCFAKPPPKPMAFYHEALNPFRILPTTSMLSAPTGPKYVHCGPHDKFLDFPPVCTRGENEGAVFVPARTVFGKQLPHHDP